MWVTSARPPGACESQLETFQPCLRRHGALSAVARHAVGSVCISGLTSTRSGRCTMSDIWTQSEGQVLDNPQSQRAAIKFIPAGPNADLQLSLWRRVKQLEHPNLLRIFETGRWRLQNRDRLYVVMEYAEENLSQILPQRSLTESEVRDMLGPVLDALVFLHGKGLVHSRIKPSNILATADQLKLSTDALFPIGESRKSSSRFDVHD